MTNEKYYGTNLHGFYIPKGILEKYDVINRHNQYRIVCKAKSRAAAERYVQGILNNGGKVFHPNYTGETGNETELNFCDKYTAIICLSSGYSKLYHNLQDIYNEVQEYKKNKSS